jgi:hypothetical protein
LPEKIGHIKSFDLPSREIRRREFGLFVPEIDGSLVNTLGTPKSQRLSCADAQPLGHVDAGKPLSCSIIDDSAGP